MRISRFIVVVAASSVIVTSACTSSTNSPADPTATSPTTPTVTQTQTRTVSPSTTSTSPSASSASSSDSAPSACAESQLRASVQAAPDVAGRHVVKALFRNTSDTACTLTGFPGAAIEDSSNNQVQQAKRVVGGVVGGTIERRSSTVALQPGRTVFAYLEGKSTREQGAAQAGCDGSKYPRILVTPPNTDTPVPFTIGWPRCYSFDVHPVRSQ